MEVFNKEELLEKALKVPYISTLEIMEDLELIFTKTGKYEEAQERIDHLKQVFSLVSEEAEAVHQFCMLHVALRAKREKKVREMSRNKMGRPKNEKRILKAIDMYHSGMYTVKEISKRTGVARSTLYENLKLYSGNKKDGE